MPLPQLPWSSTPSLHLSISLSLPLCGTQLPAGAEQELWAHFHAALEPVHSAGRMGLVVFQFHLSYAPCDEHRAYVLHCRRRLQPKLRMAVEFRNRAWLTGDEGLRTERFVGHSSSSARLPPLLCKYLNALQRRC